MKKLYQNKQWLEKKFLELGNKVKIGELVNVSGDTIEYWRKKFKIPLILKNHNKKYYFNENYFEDINTEEKAYWLGFIMADGSITKTKTNGYYDRFSIVLKNSDINHLYKLKRCLQSTHPIKEKILHDKRGFETRRAEFRITSRYLCDTLNKYGVVPNKTGKELIPEIDNNLIPHFIRGFFDGDGTICSKTQYSQYYRIHLGSSSLKIIKQIQNYFQNNYNIKISYYESNKYSVPFYYIDSNKIETCCQILKILYHTSNIYLDRKYILANKMIQVCSAI